MWHCLRSRQHAYGFVNHRHPQQVKDHVKKCIDTAGKGGEYIMANGAFFDDVKPGNLRAMVDFTKEYGVYK
jgi:uroporphyrinogen-III decarboxylase